MNIKNEIKKILNKEELRTVERLNTPNKIQDYIDKNPFNFEKEVETYHSPRTVLGKKVMHCFEGALFSTLCLSYHGYKNFLIDLKISKKFKKFDSDHVLSVFEINGFFGAISKTNHSVLRWRDPIYRDYKEIAKTYFHEYFLDSGEKTLKSYSKPFDVWKKFKVGWVISENDLDEIALSIDKSKHFDFVPKSNNKYIRKVGKTEIKGAGVEEWRR
jgi:hypothetical protein